MADSKITALTAISTVDPTADPLVIVDVSDTSMAASGTTKKSTINQLLGSGGTATLASATITGAATVGTTLGVTGAATVGTTLLVGTNATLTNGNVILGTSGKGIDFSATASGSGTMTSELLNDYEEGTFTPVVQGSSTAGTATYSFQSGQYTKVGRLVTFTLRVVYTGGTGTGNLQVGGLPFTVGVSMSNFTIYIENISLNANSIPLARSASGISYLGIEQTTTGGGTVSSVAYDAAGDIQISGFYTV